VARLISKWILNWRLRHRHAANFALHAAGIPACFLAAPLLLFLRLWWAAGICFIGGYALQFLGHLIEGNRSGEEIFLRRLLGRK